MWLIASKEMRELLYSIKFVVLALTSFFLIAIALFNGYATYKNELKSLTIGRQLTVDKLATSGSYTTLKYNDIEAIRLPTKLAVFDIGTTGVIGRQSLVTSWFRSNARDSRYKQDPALALFGELDLTFICGVVLSLFAILFGYGSVSGEREAGTLQLMISNSVRRTSVIIGKLIGLYIPLAMILLIPLLLGIVVMIIGTDFAMSRGEWLRLAAMTAVYLLYLLVFLTLALAVSALTRSSFTSFIVCLLIWVCSIAIIPKATIHIASQVSPSMSNKELVEKNRAYYSSARHSWDDLIQKYLKAHPMTEEEFRQKQGEMFEAINREQMRLSDEFSSRLMQEYRSKRRTMLDVAAFVSGVSPTSCLDFAVHSLSDTGPQMLDRFDESVDSYRKEFFNYTKSVSDKYKDKETEEQTLPFSFKTDEKGFVQIAINEGYRTNKLDLPGLPVFEMRFPGAMEMIAGASPWILVLALMAIVFFAVAYVAFLRYDVR
jgi:ABC-type transport system involved in multi-copper enzyme maturation permease subunit